MIEYLYEALGYVAKGKVRVKTEISLLGYFLIMFE
jgi:hypothetical protein